MQGENSMDVFGELIKREPNLLSRPIGELLPISFIGAAAVTAYKLIIKNLDPFMTEEQKARTLKDGQDAGVMLLAIESKIGEQLPTAKEALRLGGKAVGGDYRELGSTRVAGRVFPEGMDKNQRANARIISNNPEIVEEVIKEAKENEDIPTKTAVIKAVKIKQMERKAEYNTRPADPKPDINKELFKISETLGGLRGRVDRMEGLQDALNETFCNVIIDNCNRIIEVLGGK